MPLHGYGDGNGTYGAPQRRPAAGGWRTRQAKERERTVKAVRETRVTIRGQEGYGLVEDLRIAPVDHPGAYVRVFVRWASARALDGHFIELPLSLQRLHVLAHAPLTPRRAYAVLHCEYAVSVAKSRRAQVSPVSSADHPSGGSAKASSRKTKPARRKAARARVVRRGRAAATKGRAR